jgi:hypothetical protein
VSLTISGGDCETAKICDFRSKTLINANDFMQGFSPFLYRQGPMRLEIISS